jgi:hypothetical protein
LRLKEEKGTNMARHNIKKQKKNITEETIKEASENKAGENISETLQNLAEMITKPKEALQKEFDLKSTVINCGLSIFIVEMITVFLNIILSLKFDISVLLLGLMIGAISGLRYSTVFIIGFTSVSSFYWLLAELLGSKTDFRKQTNAIILVLTFIMIITFILDPLSVISKEIVGLIFLALLIYVIYLLYVIIKEVNEISSLKAIGIVIIPIIIIFFIYLVDYLANAVPMTPL